MLIVSKQIIIVQCNSSTWRTWSNRNLSLTRMILFPINLNGNHWTLLVHIKLTHNITLDCLHLRSLRVNGVILIVIIIKCSSESGSRNENEFNSNVSFTGF